MSRRRIEYQGDLVPFLASVFFGFAINILTAETSSWWGPLQPVTRYPWIWVPLCLLAWVGWEVRRSRHSRPRWTDSDSPYPGLEPFDAAHASVFFGREEETRDVLARLTGSAGDPKQRFVMVVGPSGSGKSSLIRGGVLSQLSEQWQVFGPIRVGSNPFGALAAAFHASGDRSHTAQRLRDDARRDGEPAYLMALMHPEVGRALLVVDQWEDLYTECNVADRALFLDLMAAMLRGHPEVYLLATMRPEHYEDAAREPALPVQDPVPLASLKPGQLRKAIEEPARAAGATFQDGLVTTMVVESTAHDSDALPLIGHLLRQLHDQASDNFITAAQYNAAGRVAGTIARQADRVYQGLVMRISRESVDRALLRAVGVEGDRTVRRAVPLANLDESARSALHAFRDARLMVETNRGEALEFTHEAVLREWPTLLQIIATHIEQLRRITVLEQRAAAWSSDDQPDDLLRGVALDQAEALIGDIAASPAVMAFLEASRANTRQDSSQRADQAAAWAQQLESHDRQLAAAVASAAIAELAPTEAATLTLWALHAKPDISTLPVAHTAAICSLVWLQNGCLRTLDETGKLCTWSAGHASDEQRLTNPAMDGQGTLSPGGKYVLGHTERGSQGLWRLEDGRYLGGRDSAYRGLERAAWRHDAMFASQVDPNAVDLYVLDDTKPVLIHTFSDIQADAFDFSPSGDHFGIAAGSKIRIYLADAWAAPMTTFTVSGEVTRLAFSPTGEHVAVMLRRPSSRLTDKLRLAVYDFGGRRVAAWPAEGLSEAFAWTPEGTAITYMQSDNDDRYIGIRGVTGQPPARWLIEDILGGFTTADKMAWSADGSRIAIGSRNARLAVWSPDTNSTDMFPGGALTGVSWSPDKSCVAIVTHSRPVRIVNAEQLLHELPQDSAGARVRWSPASNVLAVARHGAVQLYTSNADTIGELGSQEGVLGAFDWSPDGTRIALTHYDFMEEWPTVVSVWDTETRKQLSVMEGDAGANHVIFCPDGRRLAAAASGGAAIWDSDTGGILNRWDGASARISALAWSPDGQRLAVGFGENILIWDPTSTAEDIRCVGLTSQVERLCWSPDSPFIAGIDSRRLRVWDGRDGKPLATIRIPESGQATAGSRIVTELHWDTSLSMTMADGSVLTWAIPLRGPVPHLSLEDRGQLTIEDRRRYGLPAAAIRPVDHAP